MSVQKVDPARAPAAGRARRVFPPTDRPKVRSLPQSLREVYSSYVWFGGTRHDLRVSSRSSSAKSARSCATTCSISGMATRMSLKQALRRTA